MYEFHGWCALNSETDQATARIEAFVSSLQWANGFCSFRPFNGEYFVHFGGFQNRPRREAKDLEELFTLIASESPGAYGILYWRDDEDPAPPGLDEWRVRVLARGRVENRFDPFLSPTCSVVDTSEEAHPEP